MKGHVNFGVGQPSADLLPVELMRTAADEFLRSAHPTTLNYGLREGDHGFRESLAAFLSKHYAVNTQPSSLFVTAGNSQALDFICTQFTRAGDTVFVEEPSYFLAFQIFRDHGLNVVGIPMDEDGMDMDQLEHALTKHKPALLYTIPSYQNPGGQSLSSARRKRLAELSEQHGFIVAADEVYQLLWYYDAPPEALGSLAEQQDDTGSVISMGSFSKILAPALRLGWIQSSPGLIRKMLASGALNSGGCFNHFTAQIVHQAIDLGLQDEHLKTLRGVYKSRLETMHYALQSNLGDVARWRKPAGGYFFWLTLDADVDTGELRKKAGDFATGFQPGHVFSSSGQFQNCLRLSFAHYDEREIAHGIQRLSDLLKR